MNLLKEGLNLQGQQVDDCFRKAEVKGLPYAQKPLYETDAHITLPDGKVFHCVIEAYGRIAQPCPGNREEPSESGGAVVEEIRFSHDEELNEYFERLIDDDE